MEMDIYIVGEIPERPYATGEHLGRCFDYQEGKKIYKMYLEDLVKHNYNGKVVALDLSNGSASNIAAEIFRRLGATVHTMGDAPDGMNINRDCGSTHIEGLQKLVKEVGADVGFAYDGDADRCLAVDETGALVSGDHIMYLCGVDLKEKGKLKDDEILKSELKNISISSINTLIKKGIIKEIRITKVNVKVNRIR